MEAKTDLLVIEYPLELRIVYGPLTNRQQQNLTLTMRTPGHDKLLATGFLISEGVIDKFDQINDMYYMDEDENIMQIELHVSVLYNANRLGRNFITSSGCGVCGKTSMELLPDNKAVEYNPAFKVKNSFLFSLPARLREQQAIFKQTGGLHAVALFNFTDFILLHEDVGRHNAMDKLIGDAAMKNIIGAPDRVGLLSGRASFELIEKAAAAQIPVVASIGAPSSLAVEVAAKKGITLIGFLRDDSFNIYTWPQRISAG